MLSCPSPSPRVCLNSCPLNWWCHPTISSSVTPFSSCPPSFPASGSLPMSHFFASGGQSIGTSVSASVLPMYIQGWFPLELTALISLLSKELLRVFSSTAVRKHQYFSAQPSLWSSSVLEQLCCSVAQLCPTLYDPIDCSTPGFPVLHDLWVFSNSCPLHEWCHPTISSSVVPFSSCPQSFPASESFLLSQIFTSGGQSFRASASASVLPMYIQG